MERLREPLAPRGERGRGKGSALLNRDEATRLSISNLTKTYAGQTALAEASLEVPAGTLVAIVGGSGGGKSTLLKLIAGLETPDRGTVRIGDLNATGLPPQKRDIGFVFQSYALFRHMSVRDNVAFGLTTRKVPRREAGRAAEAWLARVGLADKADRSPADLSGGERQRVALARALAPNPHLLLLDEPFSAVDPDRRAELRDLLRAVRAERPVTTLFVTHDPQEAMELGDLLVAMHGGRIRQVGTPAEVYARPVDAAVARLLGPVNALGERLVRPERLKLIPCGPDEAEAVVTRIDELGARKRIVLRSCGGETVVASTDAQNRFEPGDHVRLTGVDCGSFIVDRAEEIPSDPVDPR